MDSINNPEIMSLDTKTKQDCILMDIIKELCSEKSSLSSKIIKKVTSIIEDNELLHYGSLHRLSTADESTSTVLGVLHQTSSELTFDEQAELNQAIIHKIQSKLPTFTAELEHLKKSRDTQASNKNQIKELRESINEKLSMLEEQENEKTDLMMDWINHRLQDVLKFSENSSELLTLKTKIIDLKSQILNLQILQNIFTETNQSVKAYGEIHKDLKDSIVETEKRIRQYKDIVESDND
ncbi:hypothetical protein RR48_14431 [Papilio machaon]|uniref:Uncharacterized protein n=1 Tax=Papilio machaon TaxID=76193 RepID=A0A194QKR6_PAPMA|nr:hypothetical protein RR48_14431 [Papilio machaon]